MKKRNHTIAYTSEILTIGDEVLRGDIVNGNAAYIARALAMIGLPPRYASVIPDDRSAIEVALAMALTRSQVTILTGGLGPTPDDLTRDAVAEFFGLPLKEDPDLLRHVQELFHARGMTMPETSRNQALFPTGARQIPNPHGTATGIHVERDGRHMFSLPGVPVEMQQMTDEYLVPVLREAFPDAHVLTHTLRLAGIGESALLAQAEDALPEINRHASLAYLPHHGLLDLRLTARSNDKHEAEAQLAEAEALLRERIGEHVYGTGATTLAAALGQVLVNRGQTLAVAESCTGGLVASMLTDTPGSSRWFERGWVTYSNAAKEQNLGVPRESLEAQGAVSEEVAAAMAEGARIKAGTHWAVSTTGIAGPGGGSKAKPVGMVWIAAASPTNTTTRLLQLSGLRETIKLRTAHSVFYLLWQQLMDAHAA